MIQHYTSFLSKIQVGLLAQASRPLFSRCCTTWLHQAVDQRMSPLTSVTSDNAPVASMTQNLVATQLQLCMQAQFHIFRLQVDATWLKVDL